MCLPEAGAVAHWGHPDLSEWFSQMTLLPLLVTPCLSRGLVSSLPDVPAGEPLASGSLRMFSVQFGQSASRSPALGWASTWCEQ